MPYALSNSRNLQIANRITHAATKDNDNSPELNALTELLKIDTKQPNAVFLRQFRELKNTHPFVNDLCQPRGFFGSIAYAFRGDDYRAERYKTIIDQLKQGSYIDQDHNNKISYFGTASNFKKSVCEKVEEIKNDYLAKTYTSTEDQSYKKDKKVFEELKNFNENVGVKPSKVISTDIQTKDDNDMFIWKEFVKANTEYLSLSLNNQDNVKFNINGTLVHDLKQEVLKKLTLAENTKLFTDEGNLNESVGKAIKQQQQQQQQQQHAAATKIGKAYQSHLNERMEQSSNKLRTLLSQKNVGVKLDNLSNLQLGDVIVIANADKGIHNKEWQKHGYIFIVKSLNPLKGDKLELEAYQRGDEHKMKLLGTVKDKYNPRADGYRFKEIQNTQPDDLSKLTYLVKKERVFKVKFNEGTIKKAFSNAYNHHTKKAGGYLNYVYNCNHAIYDTIIQAQILHRLPVTVEVFF